MVDVTRNKAYILAASTVVKVRMTGSTDYSIMQKIINDNVTITPVGGDPLVLEALDGVDSDISQPVKAFKLKGKIWLAPNDITLLRTVMGEPTVTGTNPYVHTFVGGSIGQQIDADVKGTQYGAATTYVQFTGTGGAMKFNSLDIQRGNAWQYDFEMTFSAASSQIIVGASSSLL